MKKFLAILMALALVMSLGVSGFASGEASGDLTPAPPPEAAIFIEDAGENPEAERALLNGYTLDYFENGGKTETGISGFRFVTDDSQLAFYYSALTEDTGDFYTIGGGGQNVTADEYDVTPEAAQWMTDLGVTAYDSALILGDADTADSCPPVISAKGYTYLNIEGALMLAAGAARSAYYSDVSDGSTVAGPLSAMAKGQEAGVVIVRNSLLETTGGEGVTGAVSVGNTGSRARGIQPQGKTTAYLYDSAIVSRTWGAWSTDSARSSLELVARRSLALCTGGYGTYADTSCHIFLYGSSSVGSADGVTVSNNGEVYAVDSDCRMTGTELRALMGKTATRDVSWEDYDAGNDSNDPLLESAIVGGQCAIQFHMPDQGHSGARSGQKGTLYMKGGALRTEEDLITGELSAYNARYAGACIVTKSTQAAILLDGTAMESWNGVLVHTMINSDSNVNDIADGDEAVGSDFTFQNMDVTGDIVHDDYQRTLRLTLDNTTLTGAIYSNTCEDWNDFCSAECGGSYILNPDGYASVWGVELTLTGGAVWNVTETSVVADLIINDGCTVNGVISENPDGTLTVAPLGASASGEAS